MIRSRFRKITSAVRERAIWRDRPPTAVPFTGEGIGRPDGPEVYWRADYLVFPRRRTIEANEIQASLGSSNVIERDQTLTRTLRSGVAGLGKKKDAGRK